jgi:polysaccharide deacetylase 2 family uncharacterized protein YibQ
MAAAVAGGVLILGAGLWLVLGPGDDEAALFAEIPLPPRDGAAPPVEEGPPPPVEGELADPGAAAPHPPAGDEAAVPHEAAGPPGAVPAAEPEHEAPAADEAGHEVAALDAPHPPAAPHQAPPAEDGPAQDEAPPPEAGAVPRIALVVGDLGQSETLTRQAIERLPAEVTLAFSPYAPGLADWLAEAGEDGHETLMMLPMEPETYPLDDPGPYTLLTLLDPAANRERLDWVLGQGSGYVGVLGVMGSRFTTAPEALEPVLADLDGRHLLFVDDGAAPRSLAPTLAEEIGLPHAVGDVVLDADPAPAAIDAELARLEDIARERGQAVGMAYPYPVTLDRLEAWLPTLADRGLELAPITAVAATPLGG